MAITEHFYTLMMEISLFIVVSNDHALKKQDHDYYSR